jgi:hypothetical protein
MKNVNSNYLLFAKAKKILAGVDCAKKKCAQPIKFIEKKSLEFLYYISQGTKQM